MLKNGHLKNSSGAKQRFFMSRPQNRQERFLIGCKKGKKRAESLGASPVQELKLRNTTKRCSCDMCGNPRRVAWSKGDSLTLQEKRQ